MRRAWSAKHSANGMPFPREGGDPEPGSATPVTLDLRLRGGTAPTTLPHYPRRPIMILREPARFANAQAVPATAASTNIIDLGATGTVFGAAAAIGRDVGKGRQVSIRASVVESFNNLASLSIGIETDDNAGFA